MKEENKLPIEIIEAIKKGQHKKIEELLQKEVNFKAVVDNSGNTILHYAARSPVIGVLDLILEKALKEKVDLTIVNKWGLTPLDVAKTLKNNVTLIAFKDKDIGDNIILKEENRLPIKLIEAIKEGELEKIKELFKAGADVKGVDNSGNTCLHHAACVKNINVFNFILEKAKDNGVDLKAPNKAGSTPLDMAIYNENENVIEAFEKNGIAPKTFATKSAVFNGGVSRSSKGSKVNLNTETTYAPTRSTISKVNKDITFSDPDNYFYDSEIKDLIENLASGLIHAASNPMCYNNDAAVNTKLTEIRENTIVLQNKGMLVTILNAKNGQGETALHVACLNGSPASVKALIEEGADIEAQDKKGRRPLHSAAFNGNPDLVEVLLGGENARKVKANIEAVENVSGWGALQIAVQPKKLDGVSQTDIQHGEELKCKKFAQKLVFYGYNVDKLDDDGCTALMQAVATNMPEVVRFLLINFADPNIQTTEKVMDSIYHKDSKQYTALHIAAEAVYGKSCAESMKILLEVGGANNELKNSRGNTALDIAMAPKGSGHSLEGVEVTHKDVIELLKKAQSKNVVEPSRNPAGVSCVSAVSGTLAKIFGSTR